MYFCIFHKNVPAMLSQISTLLSDEKINIENMVNGSKKEYAYTLIEASDVPAGLAEKIAAIENVVRVRVI